VRCLVVVESLDVVCYMCVRVAGAVCSFTVKKNLLGDNKIRKKFPGAGP